MTDGAPRAILVGDIVQIIEETHAWFPCLLTVTELKSWGIQGFVCLPMARDGTARTSQAYNRLRWEQIERVGTARVIAAPDVEPEA